MADELICASATQAWPERRASSTLRAVAGRVYVVCGDLTTISPTKTRSFKNDIEFQPSGNDYVFVLVINKTTNQNCFSLKL